VIVISENIAPSIMKGGNMKKKVILLCMIFFLMAFAAEAEKGLKVFISVDMEGVAGVIHWEDVSRSGKDYSLFRRLMTEEANAAIEGALEAGATEVLVRDSHGSARNILPDRLHPEAILLRDWSGGPLSMMEGIDETFDAVIFIGYHAREGTPDSVLKHTMTGTIDVFLNGKNMPEAGINGAQELFPGVECVSVKEGIGKAAKMLHPTKAQEMIKKKTKEALTKLKKFKPMKLKTPITMEIRFKAENDAARGSWFPGAKRTGERTVAYTHNDFMEILKFFMFAH
jgi:D-amino peptidase